MHYIPKIHPTRSVYRTAVHDILSCFMLFVLSLLLFFPPFSCFALFYLSFFFSFILSCEFIIGCEKVSQ